jgi:hypothetical protein
MERLMSQMLGRQYSAPGRSAPIITSTAGGGGSGGGNQRPIVIQNITNRQKAKGKSRKKAVRTANKQSITSARKRYTAAKKDIVKALRTNKKAVYNKENERIKQLPRGKRKAARDRLRATLKVRLSKIMRNIRPASFYKNVGLVESAIHAVRKVKW